MPARPTSDGRNTIATTTAPAATGHHARERGANRTNVAGVDGDAGDQRCGDACDRPAPAGQDRADAEQRSEDEQPPTPQHDVAGEQIQPDERGEPGEQNRVVEE